MPGSWSESSTLGDNAIVQVESRLPLLWNGLQTAFRPLHLNCD